jgi:hypothetical protein
LSLVCLKELKKKHTDSGYQGCFWGNISTRISELHHVSTGSSEVLSENQQVQNSEFLSSDDPASNDSSTQQRSSTGSSEVFSVNHPVQNSEFLSSDDPASNDSITQQRSSTRSSEVFSVNHPVQNSEFLLNDDPASNDSSKQHPVLTGSSEVLTVNQQRTDIQNLLSSLGIISNKWTLRDNFHAKFTVEGAVDNIRTRALLVVLSSFLHQRSNDQQHPQTKRIEDFFSKFVQSFNPSTKVIPFTSVVIVRLPVSM